MKTKRNKAILPFLFFAFIHCISYSGLSQEIEDGCGMSGNKKANKAYANAIDKKKNSFKERMIYFREALELDPDFYLALWGKSFAQIKQSRSKNLPFQNTESALMSVVENCPDMHSAPYFFLGEINMNKGDFEAAAIYYSAFIQYESEDDKRFEGRYEEQITTATNTYKVAQFLGFQYANPIPFIPIKISPLSQEDSDEYLPAISPDNEVILYTRKVEVKKNKRDGIGASSDRILEIERFSMSNFVHGSFEKGQAFGAPFNTDARANYGGAAITIDNREIYYTECSPIQGKMNCDIYHSVYEFSETTNGGLEQWHWTKPKSLGPNINSDQGWEAQPTISKDGKWLMYAVFKEGTRGIDLYQSKRQPNGSWGVGESMGEPINTAGNEKSPFFHSDDKTLYFASKNGHMGMGGYDVFVSRFVNGKWSIPMNLGYPLNTPDDEHGYVVSLDGRTAYFGSSSPFNGGNGKSIDIYSVTIPKKIRPDKVMMVKGTVKTKDGQVPKDASVEMRNTKTQEIELVKVDARNGTYAAIVNIQDSADYMLIAKGTDVAFNNKLIKSPKEDEPIKAKVNVEVKESKMGQHITIENIHFKTNSADINEESRASLNALIGYMKEHSGFKISVEGHTDNVGDAKANLALSTDRAYSVMAYLQEKGISSKRLKFKGWGSEKPMVSNTSANGRSQNRRIEIVTLGR
ncbi:MAG: outer membrane protein OmpA-like peptidoglycan-associated protein [Salibacteraceae bacterium]|jgi:outer membrane protein OmpA-like peptidoglycan-associated protein/tetratricopeptide (TPR) repeat protein